MRLKTTLNTSGSTDKLQIRKFYPEQWLPLEDTEDKTKSACHIVKCHDYDSDMASLIEEDRSMTLCIDADDNGYAEDEDDSSTDSDFLETSPLLADFEEEEDSGDEKDEKDGKDDCNNNLCRSTQSSPDSIFSKADDMSALKDHHHHSLTAENFKNNNNMPSLDAQFTNFEFSRIPLLVPDDVRGSFCPRAAERPMPFESDLSAFRRVFRSSNNTVDPNLSPGTPKIASHVQIQNPPDADPVSMDIKDTTLNSVQSARRLSQDLSSSGDSGASSDNDVNLESNSFNNFTFAASKHNDILYLVQQEKKPKEINILDSEHKIINTTPCRLPKNAIRSCHIKNNYAWTDRITGLKDSSSTSELHSLIADGLVLEKVNSSESWRNHTLYSSGDTMKEFVTTCSEMHNTNMPKSDSIATTIGSYDRLPNLSSKRNSPARKKESLCEAVPAENPTGVAKPKTIFEKDLDHHIPCAMDIESPIDNLNPVSAVPSEVLQTDENHNNNNKDAELRNYPKKNGISPPVATQEAAVVEQERCTTTSTPKSKSKSISPRKEILGDFDVYNIESTMPTIDWAAMEAHLTRAAAEDDWLVRRRNDREEIRKKLAMDSDTEDYYCGERVTRKPSLTTRLQSGMNLQICFMNETASDHESQGSDHDTDSGHSDLSTLNTRTPTPSVDRLPNCFGPTAPLVLHCERTPWSSSNNNRSSRLVCVSERTSVNIPSDPNDNGTPNKKQQRPSFFFARQKNWRLRPKQQNRLDDYRGEELIGDIHSQNLPRQDPTEDFYTRHTRLQAEARMALAQAKEMARMQMEVERQKSKKSPIADIVGLPFPDNPHRLSRQFLLEMNVAQLQVIVNDLHTQIENLNEDLVQLLLTRDDLHMEQDSMLVDIEDLTRYFRAKDEAQPQPQLAVQSRNITKK